MLGNILSINQSLLGKMNLGGWGPVSFSAGDRIARGLRARMLLHGRTCNVELTPGCVNRRRASHLGSARVSEMDEKEETTDVVYWISAS